MMSGIDRNWVGGISSGMDTQALIDTMIRAESFQKFSLERRRNTLSVQQEMLQEINLSLFELESKATDLTFSRTFNSKIVDSTNERVVDARATTEAELGSYTMHIHQLATNTTVGSDKRLAGSLQLGHHLQSDFALGGESTILESLGVSSGTIRIAAIFGGAGEVDVAIDNQATVGETIDAINSAIDSSDLEGALNVSYDERNNRIRFNLLDSSRTIEVNDISSDFVSELFGEIEITNNRPVADSSKIEIRSGLATTAEDMGLLTDGGGNLVGSFRITRAGVEESFNLADSGLTENSTMSDIINYLNHEINSRENLVKNGVVTGNPEDRLLEFRFANNRLQLVNTDPFDTESFSIRDRQGMPPPPPAANFAQTFFGATGVNEDVNSEFDGGDTLQNSSFPIPITSGTITIDGVQININSNVDTLEAVLSRITALTEIEAKYDSVDDVIMLKRKSGENVPIGLGSSTDTSNFLTVTGLIAGSQASAANISSYTNLGVSFDNARDQNIQESLGVADSGTLRVIISGESHFIDYNNNTDSLNDIMDRISSIKGIDQAYYDAATQRINISTVDKGSDVSIEIRDTGSGTLAASMRLDSGPSNGRDIGSTMVSARSISDISLSSSLSEAGFIEPITSGSFTLNGVRFNVGDTERVSLQDIIERINSNTEVGVNAFYDYNSGQLMLESTESGNRSVAIGDPSDTSNILSVLGLAGARQDVGQNAMYSIDGLYGGTIQVSQSNTIDNLISGVTFELKNETGPGGEVINILADTDAAREAIDEFLEAYNEATSLIFSRLTEERNWELEALTDEEKQSLGDADLMAYEEAFKIGLLSGDSTLRTARSQMRIIMSSIISGLDKKFNSLAEIGITTGVIGSGYMDTMQGTLKITDESKLTAALNEHPDKLFELFAKDSDNDNEKGVARRLRGALNEFTRSDGLLTSRAGRSGASTSNSQMDRQIGLLNNQINDQQDRLRSREEALIRQFTALETSLAGYQSQAEAFMGQLQQLQ